PVSNRFPPFHRPCRADLHAVAAVQAVLLPNDDRLAADVDALLRAFGVAELAADAAVGHKVAARLLPPAPKGEGGALDGELGEVKPLPRPLLDAKDGQRAAGGRVGVDLLHV